MTAASKKTVLVVHAHPEPASLTQHLARQAVQVALSQGHAVLESDLHAMGWKAVFDGQDFPQRRNPERLSLVDESGHAFASQCQSADVDAEQKKLLAADALILVFPLWWFSMPAIMKGWIDRVWAFGLAYGYQGAGNAHRYGEGGFAGKRALLAVCVGGPAEDYSARGINGPLEQLLFPITHGTLFFPGMSVLPTFAVYDSTRIDGLTIGNATTDWSRRVEQLFETDPIAYRPQNGGSYPDRHVLADDIAPGESGLTIHIGVTK